MAKEVPVMIYGTLLSPQEIADRETWHEKTWLEWEIPKAIEKEVSKFISKKIKSFEKQCGCGLCQLHKKHKHK